MLVISLSVIRLSGVETSPHIQNLIPVVDVETGCSTSPGPFWATSPIPLSVHPIMPHRHPAFAPVPEGIHRHRHLHVVPQIVSLLWPSTISLRIVVSFSHSVTPPKTNHHTPQNPNRYNHNCSPIPLRRMPPGHPLPLHRSLRLTTDPVRHGPRTKSLLGKPHQLLPTYPPRPEHQNILPLRMPFFHP